MQKWEYIFRYIYIYKLYIHDIFWSICVHTLQHTHTHTYTHIYAAYMQLICEMLLALPMCMAWRPQDLDKDVVLKRGYVLVYPDPARKPPKGSGLNKPATVTMPLGTDLGEGKLQLLVFQEGSLSLINVTDNVSYQLVNWHGWWLIIYL